MPNAATPEASPVTARPADQVLTTPLTPYEIGRRTSESGHLTGLVLADIDDLTEGVDALNDFLSLKMIGTTNLIDIDYKPKAVTDDEKIVIEVTGALDSPFDNFDSEADQLAYSQANGETRAESGD